MKLVKDRLGWRIEGPGCERARVAYLSQKEGRIFYEFNDTTAELTSGANGKSQH